MKEDIIHKLEASGARAKISVKTMNGEQTHLSTAVDRLEVQKEDQQAVDQSSKVLHNFRLANRCQRSSN